MNNSEEIKPYKVGDRVSLERAGNGTIVEVTEFYGIKPYYFIKLDVPWKRTFTTFTKIGRSHREVTLIV